MTKTAIRLTDALTLIALILAALLAGQAKAKAKPDARAMGDWEVVTNIDPITHIKYTSAGSPILWLAQVFDGIWSDGFGRFGVICDRENRVEIALDFRDAPPVDGRWRTIRARWGNTPQTHNIRVIRIYESYLIRFADNDITIALAKSEDEVLIEVPFFTEGTRLFLFSLNGARDAIEQVEADCRN